MAQNIFQQNVSNLYGAQQQQGHDQLKKLQQERKRTQGLENLYRIMTGQAPTFGGSSASTSSIQEGPSRAEIEAEQALQGARRQGIQTPEELATYLSGIDASLGATKAIMDESDSFDYDASNLLKSTNTAISGANELYLSQQLNSPQALTRYITDNGITDHRVISQLHSWAKNKNLVDETTLTPVYVNGKIKYKPVKEAEKMVGDGSAIYPDDVEVATKGLTGAAVESYIKNKTVIHSGVVSTGNFTTDNSGNLQTPLPSEKVYPSAQEVLDNILPELHSQGIYPDITELRADIESRIDKEKKDNDTTNDIILQGLRKDAKLAEIVKANINEGEALTNALDKLISFNPRLVYSQDMPSHMYSVSGEATRITSWNEYNDALKNNLSPNRPSFEVREKDMIAFPAIPEGYTDLAPYNYTTEDGKSKQEMRYTPSAAAKITNEAKKYSRKVAKDNQESVIKYTDGMNQLMLNTPAGDYSAIRSMEKLFDPSGVIRTSDVENIKASLGGGMRAVVENLLFKLETGGYSVELSPFERDQLAYAMNTVFNSRKRYIEQLLTDAKADYNEQYYQPWDSALRVNNGWDYDSEVASAKSIARKLKAPKWEDGRPLNEVYEYTYPIEQLSKDRPALGVEEDVSEPRDSRKKIMDEDVNRLDL